MTTPTEAAAHALTAEIKRVLDSVDRIATDARAADRAYARALVATVLADRVGLAVDKYEATFGSDEIETLTTRVVDRPKAFARGDRRRHPLYRPTLDEVREYLSVIHP